MNQVLEANELYFAVLPQIAVSGMSFGRTEQMLTLLPQRNFATQFFPDEVDTYIQVFENRRGHLVGGHVTGYKLEKVSTEDGRVVVKVTQDVEP
jgi:hypothetical protein